MLSFVVEVVAVVRLGRGGTSGVDIVGGQIRSTKII